MIKKSLLCVLVLFASCAGASAGVPEASSKELPDGVSSGTGSKKCRRPPKTYNDIERSKESCYYKEDADLACCGYPFKFRDAAKTAWSCVVILCRPACDMAWVPLDMECTAMPPGEHDPEDDTEL